MDVSERCRKDPSNSGSMITTLEMTMMLSGKRALVTEASRGIGAAIAMAPATEGPDVAITYEKSAEIAAGVVSAQTVKQRKGVAIDADSEDAAAAQASIGKSIAERGGLGILVSNAGIRRLSELKDSSLADIDTLLNGNVRARSIAIKAAQVLSVYAASNSAMAAFTKALAREHGLKEASANPAQPGSIDTDMFSANGLHAETAKQFTTLARYDAREDIASAVTFLLSPKARYITGSTLTVDGGANA